MSGTGIVNGYNRTVSILTSRSLIAGMAAAAVAAVLSSHPVRSQSQPFAPEVDEFVRTYLKSGGDKLTNWVQGETDLAAGRRRFARSSRSTA